MNYQPHIHNSFYLDNTNQTPKDSFQLKPPQHLTSLFNPEAVFHSHDLKDSSFSRVVADSRSKELNPQFPKFETISRDKMSNPKSLLGQNSFNLQEDLLEDHLGLFQSSNLNLLHSKTKNFSNSFVLNSFNPNLGTSMNFFQMEKSKSFSKAPLFLDSNVLKQDPPPKELECVFQPVQNVNKFFDLPKHAQAVLAPQVSSHLGMDVPALILPHRNQHITTTKASPAQKIEVEEKGVPLFDKNRRNTTGFNPESLNEVVIERGLGKEKVKRKIFKKRNKNNLIKTLSFLVYHYIKQKTFLCATQEIPTIFDNKRADETNVQKVDYH